MTTMFVVMAVAGFGLLVLGLVLDGLMDGVFDALDFDADGGGVLSAPVIGSFLAAFGVGGYLVTESLDANLVVALLGAALAGVVFGAIALRLSVALIDMPTDATPTAGSFQGQIGKVVTPIASGRGEILLPVGGSKQKLSAHSDGDIPRGEDVVVVEVLSSTSVRVMPISELLEE